MSDVSNKNNQGKLSDSLVGRLFGKKCPNCGKRGFLVLSKTEQVSIGDNPLPSSGGAQYEPFIVSHVRDHYYCKNCNTQVAIDHWRW